MTIHDDTKPLRVHLVGASGSGTTYVGRALAKELGCALIDTDSIFWLPTIPPFQRYREEQDRQQLLVDVVEAHERCVITGSLCGWGDVIISLLDLVVFLIVPTAVRLERLKRRELKHFGAEALAPGGEMHESYTKFMEWSASYDEGGMEIRSRMKHETWLAQLNCPLLRLEGEGTLESLLDEILRAIGEL